MLDRIKTILLVTIVTVLIWTFAEAEGLRSETVQLEVPIQSDAAAGRILRLAPGSEFNERVTARLEGATAKMDEVRDALRRPIPLKPGEGEIPVEPGEYAVDLREHLRAVAPFSQRGVTLTDVKPQFVQIRVDDIVERTAKVVVEVPDGELEGPPEPSRPTVTLRLPEDLASQLGQEPEVIARVGAAELRSLTVGRRSTIKNVRIELPEILRGVEEVSVTPDQIDVTLMLRSRTASTTLPSVPVQIRIAPVEYNKWDLAIAPEDLFLNDVVVTGPRDWVAEVEAGQLPVVAMVPLSFEELERAAKSGEPITKPVVFSELPAYLEFKVEDPMVQVSVRPRATPVNGSGVGVIPVPGS